MQNQKKVVSEKSMIDANTIPTETNKKFFIKNGRRPEPGSITYYGKEALNMNIFLPTDERHIGMGLFRQSLFYRGNIDSLCAF